VRRLITNTEAEKSNILSGGETRFIEAKEAKFWLRLN
jgi:hypothetical protein